MEDNMALENNIFRTKTHEELVLLYSQFLKVSETDNIQNNEFGKIIEEYHKYYMKPVKVAVFDLFQVLAELWYEDNKDVEKYR
jgi:hypothetical protein